MYINNIHNCILTLTMHSNFHFSQNIARKILGTSIFLLVYILSLNPIFYSNPQIYSTSHNYYFLLNLFIHPDAQKGNISKPKYLYFSVILTSHL